MMEIGIFRKDLHDAHMSLVSPMEVDYWSWARKADGHEVVFADSNSPQGTLATVNDYGQLIELTVLREWCNDFKPISEL